MRLTVSTGVRHDRCRGSALRTGPGPACQARDEAAVRGDRRPLHAAGCVTILRRCSAACNRRGRPPGGLAGRLPRAPRLIEPGAFPAWIYRLARDRAFREVHQRRLFSRSRGSTSSMRWGGDDPRRRTPRGSTTALGRARAGASRGTRASFHREHDLRAVPGSSAAGSARSALASITPSGPSAALSKGASEMTEKDLRKALLGLDAAAIAPGRRRADHATGARS